jgi:hypothetical protein
MASTPHARDSITAPAASTIADWSPSNVFAPPQADGDTFFCCAACAAIIGPAGIPCPVFAGSWHVPGHRAEQPCNTAAFRITACPRAPAAR